MKTPGSQELKIHYLHRGEIEDSRWNRTIASSEYNTAYAHTWYMDACTDQWAALATPDYEYVMPFAFRRKWGVRYTYQPRFCQQLGIYSAYSVDEKVMAAFLRSLKKKFKLGDYALNEGNRPGQNQGFNLRDHSNYTLYLGSSYEQIKQGYSENCRRNVKKNLPSVLEFSEDISMEELVNLKQKYDHTRQGFQHYQSLKKMFDTLGEDGHVQAFGVKQGPDLRAGAIFAFSKKRIHYLLSGSTEAGKEQSAMFYVIDRVVQMHSGKAMYLDFEGSDIPSLARFFSGFGAQSQTYHRFRFNNAASRFVQLLRSVRPD
jgi:hypothetical protein